MPAILDLSSLPNFSGHEHWGSIMSIGMAPEGFRADVEQGALPTRTTTLWDILIDPYFGGFLAQAGVDVYQGAKDAGQDDFYIWASGEPEAAADALRPAVADQRMTGAYQCIRRGIHRLHGVDIDGLEIDRVMEANAAIGEAYGDLFGWYKTAMDRAEIAGMVRPVHPEYFIRVDDEQAAQAEMAFTHTVLRIDPLLGFWRPESPQRDTWAVVTGIEPVDADSWRAFLEALFDLAAESGCLGIKQLQAYTRPLEFTPREDTEVKWLGAQEPEQARIFEDWVVHECCRLANERGWPHQIHVGTHNLAESGPLPLEHLARRYPNMKLVLLHCWPFIEEAGWLAKHLPNVYLDTCWQPVLNPQFLRRTLREWLNYVPSHKICCGHDATSPEMAVGSALFTREILTQTLAECSGGMGLPVSALERTALALLHGNAIRIYGTKG